MSGSNEKQFNVEFNTGETSKRITKIGQFILGKHVEICNQQLMKRNFFLKQIHTPRRRHFSY